MEVAHQVNSSVIVPQAVEIHYSILLQLLVLPMEMVPIPLNQTMSIKRGDWQKESAKVQL
jgi:hypothetical protein